MCKHHRAHGKTFADQIADTRNRADESLFERARTANGMAKFAANGNVRRLYAVKHRALHQLIVHRRVRGVRDWRPGYENTISVRLEVHHRLHCPISIYLAAVHASRASAEQ